MSSEIVRKHFIFYGQVQGVGFRWNAVVAARELGLTGWVENMPDGTVEMEAQGQNRDIARLLMKLHAARYIRISNLKEWDMQPVSSERDFREKGYW